VGAVNTIDANGALVATTATQKSGDLETLYSEHGVINRYAPLSGHGAFNLISDTPRWAAIFIDWFWIGNGVRLQSPGADTKIAGVKIKRSATNGGQDWNVTANYQGTDIMSLQEAGAARPPSWPFTYSVHGHITLLPEPGGTSGWIRLSAADGIWAGCIYLPPATPFITPLMQQNLAAQMGMEITGIRR
jgi:hypothetical protein